MRKRFLPRFTPLPHGRGSGKKILGHAHGTSAIRVALGLVFILWIPGCNTGDAKSDREADTQPSITRTATEGPVTVTLTATPETVELGEPLHLRLRIEAESGVTISHVDFEQALSEGDRQFEYRVVQSTETPVKPSEDGTMHWIYDLEVDFVLPGEFELPPAEVTFVDVRANQASPADPDQAVAVQSVATAPMTLVVREPEGAALSPEEMRKITRLDPVELPEVLSHWLWLGPMLVVVVLVAVIMLFRCARKHKEEFIVRIPAHEWARGQLAKLVADDLIAKHLPQEFYYRVSAIVRGYIERRFGITAPEMTTQEFLSAAGRDHRFDQENTEQLDEFLTSCDLVKYARHSPAGAESDAALRAADDFVERTYERGVAEPSDWEGSQVRASARAEARGSGGAA